MSAHPADIIANVIRMHRNTVGAGALGEMILSELTASGHRILEPGELDGETIEACAKMAESRFTAETVDLNVNGEPYKSGKMVIWAGLRIATALRAMKDAQK